jgi:cytoskeletal protein RodZ
VQRRPTTTRGRAAFFGVAVLQLPNRAKTRDVNSKITEQASEGGARHAAAAAEGSLGEQLRRAREARGVSLREVSEQTHITMRNLEAIEADDFKELPGGIFNRSFVKSYARHIRFDEQRALDLYERTARAGGFQTDEVATTPQRSRVYMGDPARSPWVTFLLSAAIVGALILIVYAGLHYYRRAEGAQAAGAAATPTPSAQQAATAQTPAPAAVQGFNVQVRAARSFWLTSQQDEEKKRGRFLKPDGPEEFSPQASVNLHFDTSAADAIGVTVNGQALKPPTAGAGKEIIWTITRDNYKQFAQ